MTDSKHLPYARPDTAVRLRAVLAWFLGSAGACAVFLCMTSAFLLGVWNTWLGPFYTFVVSVVIGECAAALGTCILWVTLVLRNLTHSLSYAGYLCSCAAGLLFTVCVLSPPILDQYLSSGPVLESGERASSGVGVRVGWTMLFVAPVALSFAVARRRGRESKGIQGQDIQGHL